MSSYPIPEIIVFDAFIEPIVEPFSLETMTPEQIAQWTQDYNTLIDRLIEHYPQCAEGLNLQRR